MGVLARAAGAARPAAAAVMRNCETMVPWGGGRCLVQVVHALYYDADDALERAHVDGKTHETALRQDALDVDTAN